MAKTRVANSPQKSKRVKPATKTPSKDQQTRATTNIQDAEELIGIFSDLSPYNQGQLLGKARLLRKFNTLGLKTAAHRDALVDHMIATAKTKGSLSVSITSDEKAG